MRQTPQPARATCLSCNVLIALVLLALPGFASATSEDSSESFAVYSGSDSYRFSPDLPGKFGTERLFAVLAHRDAASRRQLGPMVWRLEIAALDGRLVRITGGKVWPDVRGAALAELYWDGRSDIGERVSDGLYSFTFRARMVPMALLGGRVIETYEQAAAIAEAQEALSNTDEVVVDSSMTVEDSLQMLASRATAACAMHSNTPLATGFDYNFYYGGLHSHSNYTDGGLPMTNCAAGNEGEGTFDPAAVYDFARYSGGVDFWGIADHNHLFDEAVTESDPPVTGAKVLARYQAGLAAAAAATVDDEFVAVWAQEFGVLSAGHYLILEAPGLFGWDVPYYDYYASKTDFLALYAASLAHPSPAGALGSFAHPSSSHFNSFAWNAGVDAATQGIAVHSGDAFSTDTSCPSRAGTSSRFDTWMVALNIGFHVGPTGESDAHCNNYGVGVPTRTVYLLPNGSSPVLTKTALLTAHKNRHFFASEDPNVQIIFGTADDSHIMGDIFDTTTSVTLRADVRDPDGETTTKIELFRGQVGAGGPSVVSQTANKSTLEFTDNLSSGTNYYLIVATQLDGHQIFTAPMWVTFGAVPPCDTPPILSGTPTAADLAACADSGVSVSWTDITDWQDEGSTGSRSIQILRSTDGITWASCGVDTDLTSPFTDVGGVNGTAYLYRVKATNACGATAQIDSTTPVADVVDGPLFAGVAAVVDLDACQLTGLRVQWATPSDWNDDCTESCNQRFFVYRGADLIAGPLGKDETSYDDTVGVGTYLYRVEATNTLGCTNDGGVSRSGTEATNDGAAPVISFGPNAAPAVTSAVITWTTDEPSDSRVEYGLDASYGSSATDSNLVTSHSVTLTSLTADTAYHFRAGSSDACNGPTWWTDLTFATNPTPTGIDISGWKLVHTYSGNTNIVTIPAGTVLAPGDYVVIGRNATQAAFETHWAGVIPGFTTLPANARYLNGGDKIVMNANPWVRTLQDSASNAKDGPAPGMPVSNVTKRRTSPAAPAGDLGSWAEVAMTAASPGSGSASAGTGTVVMSEFSDAEDSPPYEFVELYYDATLSTVTLTVTKDGTGTGSVYSDPEGIDCGETCQADLEPDTVVTLSVAPDVGSSFTGWGGDCTGSDPCDVTMDAAKSVTATFALNTYSLTVSTTGSGAVASSPEGISCGAICSANFNHGTVVSLTPTPEAGWSFTGWEGACSGAGACQLIMTSALEVWATFKQPPTFTSAASTAFTIGQARSFAVTATGSPTLAITQSGTLPDGITFVDNGGGTATLSGTPAAGTSGTYELTFTASNGVSPDATQDFTLTVTGSERTTLTLASTRNPAPTGAVVRFVAKVTFYTRLYGVPKGKVQFAVDGVPLGDPVPLVSAQAASQTYAMPDHTVGVTATYSGDANFKGSTAKLVQQVSFSAHPSAPR